MRLAFCVGAFGLLALVGCSGSEESNPDAGSDAGSDAGPPPPDPDWPMYGHDAAHTFAAVKSDVSAANASKLKLAWQFAVADAVTAPPSVVAGLVYIGAWDGVFYALDAKTGKLHWKTELDCQNAVLPIPARCLAKGMKEPDRQDTDGGLVTGSATIVDGKVYIAGGRTLYELDASDGKILWRHVVCGAPEAKNCESDEKDPTVIFSSPVVFGGHVFVGHTVDGAKGYRGGIVAVDAATGDTAWTFEVDPILDAKGNPVLDANGDEKGGVNRGCGSVWSSGAVDADANVVFFTTGDCQSGANPPYHEAVIALDASTGHPKWVFRPRKTDTCDFDFGASANLMDVDGKHLVGVGSKDGTYYALDAATGALVWSKNVVFGGSSGGFIGSAAFDGKHIFGGTGIGEVGGPACMPKNSKDTQIQDPSFHAFDAATGNVLWEDSKAYTFGATSISEGAVFNGVGNVLAPELRVYDGSSGKLLTHMTTNGAVNSGAAIVGNMVFFGAGNSFNGMGGAVFAYELP